MTVCYIHARIQKIFPGGGGGTRGYFVRPVFVILQCDYNIFEFRACYIDTVDLNSCMNMDD